MYVCMYACMYIFMCVSMLHMCAWICSVCSQTKYDSRWPLYLPMGCPLSCFPLVPLHHLNFAMKPSLLCEGVLPGDRYGKKPLLLPRLLVGDHTGTVAILPPAPAMPGGGDFSASQQFPSDTLLLDISFLHTAHSSIDRRLMLLWRDEFQYFI